MGSKLTVLHRRKKVRNAISFFWEKAWSTKGWILWPEEFFSLREQSGKSQARCIVHDCSLSFPKAIQGFPLVCQSQSCIVIRITSFVIKRCLILFSVCRIIFICELSAFVSIVHDIVMRVSKYCSIIIIIIIEQ